MLIYKYGHIDTLPDTLTLAFAGQHVDGLACWAWQVFAGLVVIKTDRGTVEAKKRTMTEELAEWNALGRGIRWLADEGWKGDILNVKGCSLAVFNGMTGRDDAKGYESQLTRCKALVAAIGCKRFSVLLTEAQNEPCQILARMAHTEAKKA